MVKKKYLSAAGISFLVFISGILVGWNINRQNVTGFQTELSKIQSQIQNFELEVMLIDTMGEEVSCDLLNSILEGLGKDTAKLGQSLIAFQNTRKLTDLELDRIKRQYTFSLVKYWLFMEKVEKTCGRNFVKVLYFYSSKDCKDCENQGYLLDYIRNNYGERFVVFALDVRLDEPIIDTLMNTYNVTEVPTLVINGETYSGFVDRNKLIMLTEVEMD